MSRARTALAVVLFLGLTCASFADTLRIATFNTELQRRGPGLLLRDLTRGTDPQIAAVIAVIARIKPDILTLQSFDWDHDMRALSALADQLRKAGVDYPYLFAKRPNAGWPTELDLDGDGRLGGSGDAQGYGAFSGQAGLAILSRFPIATEDTRDLSALLWRDLPGAILPQHPDGRPFPSQAAQDVQRLSSTAHWIVPIQITPDQRLTLLTFQAAPPVFDGVEDRNGRRNHDEILLWRAVLDGALGAAPAPPFVLAGGANLDPFDSDGRAEAIRTLLRDSRLQDPRPQSPGARQAGDQGHTGENALDTVDWDGPGRLRVDYLLPSRDLRVVDAGVYWPAPDSPDHAIAQAASRHRLVWVDLSLR